MIETRAMAEKRRRLEYEQAILPTEQTDTHIEPSITSIPLEILFRIIFFAITTNEDAKTTWPICSLWMKFTDEIVAKMNPLWDFKSHYISPMRFIPGYSFWTPSFFQMTRDVISYGAEIQNDNELNVDGTMETRASIWIRRPNIIEIFDSTSCYKFAFRFECPITKWDHDEIMQPQAAYVQTRDIITVIQKVGSLDDDKTRKKIAINYYSLMERSPILELMDYDFNCKLSYESLEKLDIEISAIVTNKQIRRGYYGRAVCLCINRGVFVLATRGFNGTSEWIPIWNDKGISTEDMTKIWTEDGRRKRCHVTTAVVKTWINHLNLIKPFDFVNLELISPDPIWEYSRIYSSVVKDGISACFKF